MAFTPVVVLNASNASTSMGAFQDASSVNYPAYTLDSNMPHYRASTSFTPQATSALTVAALKGSASKTIRVTRVAIGGSATALSSTLFLIRKVSALGAGGTVVTPTVAKLDSESAAATAVAEVYTTTAKAADTAIDGSLCTFQLFQTTVTTPTVAYNEQMVVFPERGGSGMANQAIVLRGTSEILAITNANGGNLAAGSILQVTIEWREDAS